MSEDELGTLESEINRYGQGYEEQAVAAWLKKHPLMVGRMTPSYPLRAHGKDPANHIELRHRPNSHADEGTWAARSGRVTETLPPGCLQGAVRLARTVRYGRTPYDMDVTAA
jgi:hypothetical protein